MHASIDQLLSLRDGDPVDAQMARHMEDCDVCAAELARLKRVRHQLQSLALLQPPPAALHHIAVRAGAGAPRRQRFAAAAAAAVIITIASGLIVRYLVDPSQQDPSMASVAPVDVSAEPLEQLLAQSRELESILQTLPERPAVERVSMAGSVDVLEQRIQLLDLQLSYTPETELNDEQAYELWRERVELMDSLVKVRYAEVRHMSF